MSRCHTCWAKLEWESFIDTWDWMIEECPACWALDNF